jgi:hypothetical protein
VHAPGGLDQARRGATRVRDARWHPRLQLYFAIDTHLRTGVPLSSLVFARDGITRCGGLIMGTLVGAIGSGIPASL